MTKYKFKFIAEYKKNKGIKESGKGQDYFYCKLCKRDLSLISGGQGSIDTHLKSDVHKKNLNVAQSTASLLNLLPSHTAPTLIDDKTAAAEGRKSDLVQNMSNTNGNSVDKPNRKPGGQQSRSPAKKVGTNPTTTAPASGKRIRVYRNGDPFHKGINVVLNMRHSHDINSFLDAISERIGLVSGVKRLYTLNGNQIKSTNALENNKEYVASSGGFMPLNYGTAYKQHQAAFLPKKEESSFSLASSKRSLPTRMSRSSTELRSTSRDLSVRSLNGNGIHSAKSNVSSNSQKPEKTVTKRSKSLVTRKKTVEKTKPTITQNKEQKDEKPKKKRVKKSPSSAQSNKSKTEENTQQNGKSKSPPKRRIKKKKSVAKDAENGEDHKNPEILVQQQHNHESDRDESHLSSSAASGANRPPSRHSSRASKRPETTESRKSSRRESVEHTDRTGRTNESRRGSEAHEKHEQSDRESDHHSRPQSHHSHRSTAHSSPTKHQSPRDEEDNHSNHNSPSQSHDENSPRKEENHHKSGHEEKGITDESGEESENNDEEKSPRNHKHNVPLEAL